MARQEKGSRMRLPPARVQLQQRDSISGSYPTVVRFSTDGRTGNGKSFFDDTKTILFASAQNVAMPAGLPSSSVYMNSSEYLTGLTVSQGNVVKGIGDNLEFVERQVAVSLRPFNDSGLNAADATSNGSEFYATGSKVTDIGEGFTSPLWSKQKIEIDLGVTQQSSLTLVSSSPGTAEISYPMAYYNFDLKYWEPLGLGECVNFSTDSSVDFDRFLCGFTPSLLPDKSSQIQMAGAGYATSDFGFPFAPKYHATSSQLLPMANYITEPFVLEKMTVEFSASWYNGPTAPAYELVPTATSSINTCFVLNQRKNQTFSYQKSVRNVGTDIDGVLTASVPTYRVLSVGGNPVYIDTVRDIVSFGGIFSFASGVFNDSITVAGNVTTIGKVMPITSNDIVLTSSITGKTGADWSGQFILSMSACTPAYTSGAIASFTPSVGSSGEDNYYIGYDGYRTGMGFAGISSRGYLNDFFATGITRTSGNVLGAPMKKFNINPYILLPSDNLIVGFQLPMSIQPGLNILPGYADSQLFLRPGSFKLVLYGSYIRESHEENETLNQLLSSVAIHEAI